MCSSAAGPALGAHPDRRREPTLCTTREKKILEDVGYWLEGTEGLLPRLSLSLEEQSSAKGAGFHTAVFVRTSGAPARSRVVTR